MTRSATNRERPPVHAAAKPREGGRVLVAIPCLDEGRTVAEVVRAVPREIEGAGRVDVVVFDDGSTDDTSGAARGAGAEVIRYGRNRGLGSVFRSAVDLALLRDACVFVQIDGDGQFDPADIPKLVEPVVRGDADMVTASRFLDAEFTPPMPWIKRWGNSAIARIVQLLTGQRFHDVSCGFRAFSRHAVLHLNLFGTFTYTQETFLDLVFKGLEIREVPVHVRGTREFGESRMAASLPMYAVRSLAIMLRAFISYRPFRMFLVLSVLFFLPGIGLLTFLGVHYARSGAFSPHIWAGFVGGSLCFVSIVTLVIGLIGDMLVRIRLNQESLLYRAKAARGEGSPGRL